MCEFYEASVRLYECGITHVHIQKIRSECRPNDTHGEYEHFIEFTKYFVTHNEAQNFIELWY